MREVNEVVYGISLKQWKLVHGIGVLLPGGGFAWPGLRFK
ncbi:hypothetical protein CIT292_09784 [Citrobacter youngae ATCC 29220]|uniref:Uncharacterized protein n=1 Tax=Citrobacter youngae ATCC 29220 TaxID=500640 RepID=D4BGX7_9ENTR|nr:hypothetical protein CIT292_09784 [Citrobacter youngae ATCC 29220]